MITVATKLDVPIKLVFQGKSGSNMLGLGDIVIPGIFIALALRFDLWRYYQKQITHVPTELKAELSDETSTIVTKTQSLAVKAEFIDPQGRWGDRFWTLSLRNILSKPTASPGLVASAFPRTYFYCSMIGYAVGMLLTLAMLLVFKHGQPALLYLVPCVTGAVWLTGAIRGELHDLWTYTEDGSLDTEDIVVDVDGNGNVIKEFPDKADGKVEEANAPESDIKESDDSGKTLSSKPREGYDVFLFSITAPNQEVLKSE